MNERVVWRSGMGVSELWTGIDSFRRKKFLGKVLLIRGKKAFGVRARGLRPKRICGCSLLVLFLTKVHNYLLKIFLQEISRSHSHFQFCSHSPRIQFHCSRQL